MNKREIQKEGESKCATGVPGRSALNRWIVANPFMNYKTAYLAALLFLYDMTLAELVHNPETLDLGKNLGRLGRLCRYPTQPGIDSFDVNLVLGLGRTDIARDRINTFFLAAQFYQIEMYTRQVLKSLP